MARCNCSPRCDVCGDGPCDCTCTKTEKMTLHDRVEFALRDAGFGLDESSQIATLAEAHLTPSLPAGRKPQATDFTDSQWEDFER